MKKNNNCNTKVKNPCKICLEPVTNKTGLQCKGACSRWAHFSCLNYTPGKIQDIKTGILKVLCPCPGCKTAEPKEYLTNPPYTCPDQSCAAKQVPQCHSSNCPLNKPKPPPPSEISKVPSCRSTNCPANKQKPPPPSEIPQLPKCRSSNCPVNKKKPIPPSEVPPQVPKCRSINCPLNKQKRTPTRQISFDSNRQDSTDEKSDPTSEGSNQSIDSHHRSCPPPPCVPKKKQHSRPHSPSPTRPQTPPREKKHPPPSRTPSSKNIAQRVCPKPKNEKGFAQKKSMSCSCISKDSRYKMKTHTTSSDSHISTKNQKVLYQALEDMCNTVGQLSLQLKELMCRMIETIQTTGSK